MATQIPSNFSIQVEAFPFDTSILAVGVLSALSVIISAYISIKHQANMERVRISAERAKVVDLAILEKLTALLIWDLEERDQAELHAVAAQLFVLLPTQIQQGRDLRERLKKIDTRLAIDFENWKIELRTSAAEYFDTVYHDALKR